jgi:hypothetical protein
LRGKALSMPDDRLVAIQVQDAATFRAQRTAANDSQVVCDGFFVPRDNVAVFSSTRLDPAYQVFSRSLVQQMWQDGWKREELLAGKDIPRSLKKGKDWKETFRRCQTLALVDKALENEAELAAVGHEGTRQLAIAANLIPGSVMLPEWLQFGFASLFDTPKGPYPLDNTAQTSFWPSYGAPNWAYIRPFQIWQRSKEPEKKLDDPAVAIRRTITDYYFRNTRKDIDEEIDPKLTDTERKQKEREIGRAKEDQLRARALAWALVYYLAKYHTDDLLTYFHELSNQPRDLEMDEHTNLLAFGRAMKLLNAAGDDLDEAKLASLGREWFASMMREPVPGPDYRLEPRKKSAEGSDRNKFGLPGGGNGFGGGAP